MSAPVTERPAVRTAPRRPVTPGRAAVAPESGADRATRGGATVADSAARRAYARRDERVRRSSGAPRTGPPATPRRAQFVLLVMGLLTTALVLTLWLSTAATADSYRLQAARESTTALAERAESLHRDVAIAASPTELARRAGELGMVPVQDAARLVVAPDGSVTVIGDPTPVRAPAPPVAPAPPAGEAPGAVPPPAGPGPVTEDAVVAAEGAAADPPGEVTTTDPAATDPSGPDGDGPATPDAD